MDNIVLDFISKNWFTIYLFLTLLKGLAILTPSVKDDQILTLLFETWGTLRGKAEKKDD